MFSYQFASNFLSIVSWPKILSDFECTVIWVVSAYALIFNSSSFVQSFWGPFQARQLQLVSPLLSSPTFLVLRLSLYAYLIFRFLWFSICGSPGQQSPTIDFAIFLLIILFLVFWSGLENKFLLKIPENFMHLFLKNRFWLLHKPLNSNVKFQFLARFTVDHLPNKFVFSFILPLR